MLSACLGLAQDPPAFHLGAGITPPFVATKPPPGFSDEARIAKLEGSVLLSLIVGANGRPRDMQVIRPLGLGLDESAIENVKTWTFKPGTKNGVPVDVRVNEEVFFRPKRALWDWHLVRAVFQTPPGGIRPIVFQAKFPATVDVEENASVTIAFDVGTNGAAANLRVVKSSDARWERELLAAVHTGWRFRAGTLEGKLVMVPAWFEFVRGSHSPIPALPIPLPKPSR